MAWAKASEIPVQTTALLRGVRPGFASKTKVDDGFFLKVRKEGVGILSQQTIRLEKTEIVSRTQSPSEALPERFVSCLQLHLAKPISLGAVRTSPTMQMFDWPPAWPQTIGVAPLEPLSYFPQAQLVIVGATDVAHARGITAAFANLHESGFDLALDLYIRHLHRDDPRERAVDIAIALENLYLQRHRGELTYRFSIHVATFSRRLAQANRISRRTAEKLYGARSNVVHGSKPLARQIELLNSVGADLARATLIAIASNRNRQLLQNIGRVADDLVNS